MAGKLDQNDPKQANQMNQKDIERANENAGDDVSTDKASDLQDRRGGTMDGVNGKTEEPERLRRQSEGAAQSGKEGSLGSETKGKPSTI